jgi:phage antirepressor YoqD-like protein
MRDIKSILEQAEIGVLKFEGSYLSKQGKELPCFNLPRRECDIVVSGYSVKYRMAIIDRWLELEAKQVDPMQALNDPAVMRGLLLGYTERVLALESQVNELEPKAEALERIAISSDGTYCIRDTAKIMQMQEKKFISWLIEHEWVYRRTGQSGLIAYAPILKKGYMEHKLTSGDKTDGSGEQWSKTQARVTAKGIVKLAKLIGAEMADAA